MDKVKSCPTPMAQNVHLSATEGEPIKDPTIYKSAIGALQCLTHTRPDLSFSVNKLNQFLQCPIDSHWKELKRIFRYLQGTIEVGLYIKVSPLIFSFGPSLPLSSFSDVDWAASWDNRKSIGGYCVFLGESLVSRSSRKQHVVAWSSTKSEYRFLSNLAVEILWIRSLLNEIKIFPLQPLFYGVTTLVQVL